MGKIFGNIRVMKREHAAFVTRYMERNPQATRKQVEAAANKHLDEKGINPIFKELLQMFLKLFLDGLFSK